MFVTCWVSLQVKLSSLNLDYHARDKLLRLVGDRYEPDTDLLTITTDRSVLSQLTTITIMH